MQNEADLVIDSTDDFKDYQPLDQLGIGLTAFRNTQWFSGLTFCLLSLFMIYPWAAYNRDAILPSKQVIPSHTGVNMDSSNSYCF